MDTKLLPAEIQGEVYKPGENEVYHVELTKHGTVSDKPIVIDLTAEDGEE
jgi:hypothetical protein